MTASGRVRPPRPRGKAQRKDSALALPNVFAISVGTISEAGRASAMLVSSLGKLLNAHSRFKMDLTAYQDIIPVDRN